jgi:hypothetical protein
MYKSQNGNDSEGAKVNWSDFAVLSVSSATFHLSDLLSRADVVRVMLL